MLSKAVKDLPDPLDQSPTTSGENPDDLLSQMADEAIDKLMAEADKDDLPPRRTPPAPVPTPIIPAPIEVKAIEPSPEPEPEEAALSPLAAALDQRVGTAPAPEAHEDDDMPMHAFESAPDDPLLAAAVENQLQASLAEAPHSAADVKALLAEPDAGEGAPSIVLLPLRIVNAPFSVLSDTVRDAMGQIAIVTLLNAIGVIAYVLIFRRHH